METYVQETTISKQQSTPRLYHAQLPGCDSEVRSSSTLSRPHSGFRVTDGGLHNRDVHWIILLTDYRDREGYDTECKPDF
jgi:hypothetical protein